MRTAVVRSGVGETINLGSGLGGKALFVMLYGEQSLRTPTPPSDDAAEADERHNPDEPTGR
jgi:hypothetical protein